MQVWNLLHAASLKYRMQKIAKNLPSGHHRTTLSGYTFVTKARIDNRKKLVKQRYLLQTSSQYGELTAHERLRSVYQFGAPQQILTDFAISRLGFVTAAMSLSRDQRNFARCLAVSWAGTLYIHFWGLLPPHGILAQAKFTLHPSLAFSYIGSITAWLYSSRPLPDFAAWYKEWNYGTFAEGATYIRLGGHHVRHWPTF